MTQLFLCDGCEEAEARQRYQTRRARFRNRVKGVVVIAGVKEELSARYPWLEAAIPVFQEPLFLYLTGLNQPGAVLVMDSKSGEDVLFLPPWNEQKERWDGLMLGSGEGLHGATYTASVLGVDRVEMIETLKTAVVERARGRQVSTLWHLDGKGRVMRSHESNQWKTKLRSWGRSQFKVNRLTFSDWEHRLILDDIDLGLLRKAIDQTATALQQQRAQLDTYDTEYEMYANLQSAIMRLSPFGPSFPSIVASGANACILHYRQYTGQIKPGQMILIDCGVKQYGMHADISRTWPVLGTYTPLQKQLYGLVLSVQNAVEERLKAGVTLSHLNTVCWDLMEQGLQRLKASIGLIWIRNYDRMPHYVGHLLAHQVHDGDPTRQYQHTPLKPGMVITNEPGLYGQFSATIDGVYSEEAIGIRIEDDLLVLADGCENLSSQIPK